MARLFKFKKEDIINAAYDIVSEKGVNFLTARELAKKLGSSSKVIFGLFKGMDEVKEAVLELGYKKFYKLMGQALTDTNYLPYVSCGLAYINIAKENPRIFRLLFMRDTTSENENYEHFAIEPIIKTISLKSHVTLEEAKEIHDKYWFFMHGMAVVMCTSFLNIDDEYIVQALKDNYESLVKLVKERNQQK